MKIFIIEIDYKTEFGGFKQESFRNITLEEAYAKCARTAAVNETVHCINLYKHVKAYTYKHIARFFPNGMIETDNLNDNLEFYV